MKRREFFKASVAAGAAVSCSLAAASAAERARRGKQEYYELRAYRIKEGNQRELLEAYLEKALVPALNRLKVHPVGVFTEEEPKDGDKIWTLIPYSTLDSFADVTSKLNDDKQYQSGGAEYLALPKDKPGFDRIDSWFLLAFAGMPKIEQPVYSREKKPRIFELRTYESHSELKALKKVEMFNSGEIDVMREVGLAPVFYGQALMGRDLPHLTYMLAAEDRDAHKKHWAAFGGHPTWKKMNGDPQFKDTVSKITSRFLAPTSYSEI